MVAVKAINKTLTSLIDNKAHIIILSLVEKIIKLYISKI
jgi:hypothetical protein